jgi:hypothetical protein
MVRNLYILNILPFKPTLSWLNNTEPGEVSFIAGIINMDATAVISNPTAAPHISINLFKKSSKPLRFTE